MASITARFDELLRRSKEQDQSASHFRELTELADSMRVEVEERWDSLAAEERETLSAFAYAIVEPPKGVDLALVNALGRAVLFALGERQALLDYALAMHNLIEAILTQIEEHNPKYQDAVAKALQEFFANRASREFPEGKELEYLHDLSRRAFDNI